MLLKSRPQFYALSKNNHELFLKDELFETTHFIADTLVSQNLDNRFFLRHFLNGFSIHE